MSPAAPVPLELRSLAELDRIVVESAARPVVIFKYSASCGTSAHALDELLEHMADADPHRALYAMVTVQTDRHVSNAIAQRFGVRHETPQLLLVQAGTVEWTASHFRVNAGELTRALAQLPARPPTPTTTPTGS